MRLLSAVMPILGWFAIACGLTSGVAHAQATRESAAWQAFRILLANDDQLNVVGKYSVTSTYLIDKQGIIKKRWLDRVHDRVGSPAILEAIRKLGNR